MYSLLILTLVQIHQFPIMRFLLHQTDSAIVLELATLLQLASNASNI